ncbi:TadE family type IV pilus minor pilin [Raineyella fluvialis]|uniref:TadE-like protein n=1 Tax=Raineyella fluvialis TaxID=2662261 RepID=A0A5Q2F7L4_9ACTN|nr:TadE family type IV pilus minor pilin [Raineyella fluvialis]QGF22829.1 hypothetical protein Rai3103_03140 [Raineyella fluvialis]
MQRREVRSDRGMVTAELALGTVVIVLMTLVFGWGLHLFTRQLLLEDTVAEVARQSARGDRMGVVDARADAPAGTRLTVTQESGVVRVRGELPSGPAGRPERVVLVAEARVLREPGSAS